METEKEDDDVEWMAFLWCVCKVLYVLRVPHFIICTKQQPLKTLHSIRKSISHTHSSQVQNKKNKQKYLCKQM